MKLSIIVPVYNTEKFVTNCLDSIFRNTVSFDFEVIVVNDASPDSSQTILEKLQKKYKFKVINHIKNKGLSESRNTGILNATGDYVIFVDSDDMVDIRVFQGAFLNKEMSLIDVLQFNHSEKASSEIKYKLFTTGEGYLKTAILSGEYSFSACMRLYSLKFIMDNNLFFLPDLLHEDVEYTAHLYSKAHHVLYCNQCFYFITENPNSITTTINFKRLDDLLLMSKNIACYIGNDELKIEYLSKVAFSYLSMLALFNQNQKEYLLKFQKSNLLEVLAKSKSLKSKITYLMLQCSPDLFLKIYRKIYEK